MISNKKLNQTVNQLFIRGRTPNIAIVFITQSYFAVPKDDYTQIFKQMRASANLTEVFIKYRLKDFINIYKVYCKTIFFFSESFRKNIKTMTDHDN